MHELSDYQNHAAILGGRAAISRARNILRQSARKPGEPQPDFAAQNKALAEAAAIITEAEAKRQPVLAALGMSLESEADSPCLQGCKPSEGDVCGGPRCT